MSDLKRKIGEGAIWLSFSGSATKLIGFAYMLILLNQLAVYEYGLSKLALSVPVLLSFLGLGGLYKVMVVDVSSLYDKGDVKEMRYVISSFFSAKFILGLIATAGLFVSTFLLKDFFSEDILVLVRVLSLTFIIGPARSLILLFLNVSHNFKKVAIFSVSEEITKLLAVSLFLLWFDYGVLGVILASIVTDYVATILFIPVIFEFKNRFLGGKLFSNGILHPLYAVGKHAKWSLFIEALYSVSENIRPWIIQFILGMDTVGIYSIAISILKPVQSLVPIGKVMLPIMPRYKDDPIVMTKLINSSIKYKLYSSILLSIITITLLPVLFVYLPDYSSAYWLFISLLTVFIPLSFSQIFGVVFQTFCMQKDLFIAYVVNILTIIMLLPVSIYFYGLYGVAIELFITQAIFMYGRYRSVKKVLPEYKLPVKEIISFTQTDKWIFTNIKKSFFRVKAKDIKV